MNRANEVNSAPAGSANSASAVFVIDADPSVRASLESVVTAAGWQLRSFASAREFLAMPRVMAPGCLVLDVTLPDASGLEVQKLLVDRPELPVIFLTAVRDVSVTVQAMKAGAAEFLTRPCGEELLLSVIEQALHRSRETLAQELEKFGLRDRYRSLSVREREVMALVVTGLLNKQIGGELGISEITVKAHRGKLMRKMMARSLAELVAMALTLQLAPNGDCPRRATTGWLARFEPRAREGATLGVAAFAGGIA